MNTIKNVLAGSVALYSIGMAVTLIGGIFLKDAEFFADFWMVSLAFATFIPLCIMLVLVVIIWGRVFFYGCEKFVKLVILLFDSVLM